MSSPKKRRKDRRQTYKNIDEAWEAWERSCLNAEKEVTKTGKIEGQSFGSEVTSTVEGQYGDPRFLEIIRNIIADRRKCIGTDAPSKFEDVTPMTSEERRARLAKLREHPSVQQALSELQVTPDGIESKATEMAI